MYYIFGTVRWNGLPLRDEDDLPFEQFIVDSWTSFARTYNPNPDPDFLKARGFTNTSREMEAIVCRLADAKRTAMTES
jgi:hypothetical protein